MQQPFKVTEEMMKDVDDEIAQLTANGKESHDTAGARPSSVSLRRRNVHSQDSGSPVPGPIDSQALAVPEDPINPSHYRRHPSGIECIEVTRHMNFNVGNAVKYIWRYQDRGDPIENLKKAQWYLNDEITRLMSLMTAKDPG